MNSLYLIPTFWVKIKYNLDLSVQLDYIVQLDPPEPTEWYEIVEME
ncbi:hypothetical protein [Methanobacterium sp.]